MIDWKDLRYLQAGNARQQHAYAVLQALAMWPLLADFDPVLAGTIPLAIDTSASDLDVLCEVAPATQERFRHLLSTQYGQLPGFRISQHIVNGVDSVVVNFSYQGTELEVFGQAQPTCQQAGYRHMVVEHAILVAGGEAWRQEIRRLKHQGMKTEPAFAALLHISGNPYEALLTLENQTPAELQAYVARHPISRGY